MARDGKRKTGDASVQRRAGTNRRSTPRWAILLVPIGVLVMFAIVVGLSISNSGSGSEEEPAAGERDREIEREADRLRAEFAERDRRQIEDLTGTARRASESLAPALKEMSEYLPPDAAPANRVAGRETVEGWKEAARAADEEFGDPPSGETATNVARGSLDAAVDAFGSAARTYETAAALPADERRPVLERASEGRDLAIRIWSVGATQLDAVNVEAGNGHQHIFLPANGFGGAFTADPEAEGSGARKD